MIGMTPAYRDSSDNILRNASTTVEDLVDESKIASQNGFRLPSEWEWELAARWKNDTSSINGSIEKDGRWWTPGDYACGATADYSIATATQAVAWYNPNCSGKTQDVGDKPALGSMLGLYDMSGNVREWCWEIYTTGVPRNFRGGCYLDTDAQWLAVSKRGSKNPYEMNTRHGLRVARASFLSATEEITAASVTITAPVVGGTPETATVVEAATSHADYTVTGLTWNQALTAGGKFKASQVYTATVTLTAKPGKKFQAAAFTPTVAGSASVSTTSGMGNTVSFTVTYASTGAFAFTSFAIATQPTKLSYSEITDNILALNGMGITETYNDGSTATVAFTSGTAASYTASPANGTSLTIAAHNGTAVTITHTPSSQTATTSNLFVGNHYTSTNVGNLLTVPAGTFQVDSTPTNLYTVSSFRMGQYEITRAQYLAIMGTDPSTAYPSGTSGPVEKINWYHAIAFCNKLSIAEGLDPVYSVSGVNFTTLTYAEIPLAYNDSWSIATCNWSKNGYRLPTTMEWMWAAMGADTSNPGVTNTTGYLKAFSGDNGSNAAGDYVWYTSNNTPNGTKVVGTKLANELGLYDLCGNVWEWSWGPLTDSHDVAAGDREYRGGSYSSLDTSIEVSHAASSNTISSYTSVGMRVVRSRTVSVVELSAATASMTAPVLGATPETAATVEAATSNADYTVTGLTWNQALTAAGKFKAGQVYSATLTLTSKNSKRFQTAAFTPTVAGSASVGTTTTTGWETGNTVTFTATYTSTGALTVTGISVATQPTHLSYAEGTFGFMQPDGMEILETHNDGSTATITFPSGTAAGYTTSPANHATLTNAAHDGNPVTVTHTASAVATTTNDLSVLATTKETHVASGVSFMVTYVPASTSITFPTGLDDSGEQTVASAFWLGETEVTYELWYTVRQWAIHADRGANQYTFANAGLEGSTTGGGTYPYYYNIGSAPTSAYHDPATMMSWRDAVIWCNALSELLGRNPAYRDSSNNILRNSSTTVELSVDESRISANNGFRLPTEWEWELAARWKNDTASTNGSISKGGRWWTPGDYASGATDDYTNASATLLAAWFDSGLSKHVGQKPFEANHLGIYDMSGNVIEKCWNIYDASGRSERGGWADDPAEDVVVSSYGDHSPTDDIRRWIGFRVARP